MRFLALLALTLPLGGCARSDRLPRLGQVAPFELTSQSDSPVRLADLQGKVWVADTFFTTCTGPCPMMTAKLRSLAKTVADLSDVRFVSLTVDPDHDSPSVMNEYSAHFHADPKRWLFLTGSSAALDQLARDSLHLSPVDGSLEHSTEFALVDRRFTIRGYYRPFDRMQFDKLAEDLRWLVRQ